MGTRAIVKIVPRGTFINQSRNLLRYVGTVPEGVGPRLGQASVGFRIQKIVREQEVAVGQEAHREQQVLEHLDHAREDIPHVGDEECGCDEERHRVVLDGRPQGQARPQREDQALDGVQDEKGGIPERWDEGQKLVIDGLQDTERR